MPAEEGAAGDAHLQAFLEEEQLERHPRAGVIVATSGDQETHEWARYRGGILSHELRSALSGAADVNGDGRIEYSELRAFLAAANARVRNPEARVDVFARAPALDRHRALVDLRASAPTARFLHFGAGLGGRFLVEDDRGVRVADLNKEPARRLRRDGLGAPRLLRARATIDETRGEVRAPAAGASTSAALSWHARAIAARGALDADLPQRPLPRAVRPRLLRRLRGHLGRSARRGAARRFVVVAPRRAPIARHRISARLPA